MTEDSELMKTARKIEDLDKQLKDDNNQIEVIRQRISQNKDLIHNLTIKIQQLTSQFSYGQIQPKIESRHITSIKKLTEVLGPAVYKHNAGYVRQKQLEWAFSLPFIDGSTAERYCIERGYSKGGARSSWYALKHYLKEHNWTENENRQLVKPTKLDLTTATKQEKEGFLK